MGFQMRLMKVHVDRFGCPAKTRNEKLTRSSSMEFNLRTSSFDFLRTNIPSSILYDERRTILIVSGEVQITLDFL